MTDDRLDCLANGACPDSDEFQALFDAFMNVKDRKARTAIIKLAERCAHFGQAGLVSFRHDLGRN